MKKIEYECIECGYSVTFYKKTCPVCGNEMEPWGEEDDDPSDED